MRTSYSELHPLIDVSEIEAGVWTPCDGDVDPTTLTNAVAKIAKQLGATYKLNAEVTSIERKDFNSVGENANRGLFVVKTADGQEFEADTVVNAGGLWSTKVSEMLGVPFSEHPAYVIEHQYVISQELPKLAEMMKEGKRLPVLRDLAGSSYIRQERTGLLIGPYEADTKVRTDWVPCLEGKDPILPEGEPQVYKNKNISTDIQTCIYGTNTEYDIGNSIVQYE